VWKTKEGNLQLVTAPLDAKVILEGITRGSVLELARQRLVSGSEYLPPNIKDLEVVERNFTMLEIEEAWEEGRIVEAFLTGTA
jgi:branched-chain amino acid aminotransferase